MRGRGVICIAATVAIAAAFAAPGAFAASSQQIYRDYADNGRIDGHYSRADLRQALRHVQAQGHAKPRVSAGLASAIRKALDAQPTRGLSGSGNGPTGGLPFGAPTGGLPFTGFNLPLMLLGGLGLLILGAGLRKLGPSKA